MDGICRLNLKEWRHSSRCIEECSWYCIHDRRHFDSTSFIYHTHTKLAGCDSESHTTCLNISDVEPWSPRRHCLVPNSRTWFPWGFGVWCHNYHQCVPEALVTLYRFDSFCCTFVCLPKDIDHINIFMIKHFHDNDCVLMIFSLVSAILCVGFYR